MCCGYGTGADYRLGFVLQVIGVFFLGADVWVGEHFVEDVRLAFWLNAF